MPLSKDERVELSMLKDELEKLQKRSQSVGSNNLLKNAVKMACESDSEEDEDEEYLDELEEAFSPINNSDTVQQMQRNRQSVSAEVYSRFHKKEVF